MSLMLVTGSRHYNDVAKVWQALFDMEQSEGRELVLIVGDCPTGADLWARRWCYFYQRPALVFEADWENRGRAAGPERNQAMVDERPVIASAFLVDFDPCRGTRDCGRRLKASGIPTTVYR